MKFEFRNLLYKHDQTEKLEDLREQLLSRKQKLEQQNDELFMKNSEDLIDDIDIIQLKEAPNKIGETIDIKHEIEPHLLSIHSHAFQKLEANYMPNLNPFVDLILQIDYQNQSLLDPSFSSQPWSEEGNEHAKMKLKKIKDELGAYLRFPIQNPFLKKVPSTHIASNLLSQAKISKIRDILYKSLDNTNPFNHEIVDWPEFLSLVLEIEGILNGSANLMMLKQFLKNTSLYFKEKQKSYKKCIQKIYEEIGFNFCLVKECLRFQCTPHARPNLSNPYSISRNLQSTYLLKLGNHAIPSNKIGLDQLQMWITNMQTLNPKDPKYQCKFLDSWLKKIQTQVQDYIFNIREYQCRECQKRVKADQKPPDGEQDEVGGQALLTLLFLCQLLDTQNACYLKQLLPKGPSCSEIYQVLLENRSRIQKPQFIRISDFDARVICDDKKQTERYYKIYHGTEQQKVTGSWIAKTYKPCDHQGRCEDAGSDCTCHRNGTFCEQYCGCKQFCMNIYFGCECKDAHECNKSARRKSGYQCLCSEYSRECITDRCLCSKVKMSQEEANKQAMKKLKSVSKFVSLTSSQERKYNQEVVNLRECQNMKTQNLDTNTFVFIAPCTLFPKIAGLYTLFPLQEGQFITHYTGKIKPDDALEEGMSGTYYYLYHSLINEHCNRPYSFTLDEHTDVNSVDVGSLMRFANHAHQQEYPETEAPTMANCTVKIIFNGSMNCANLIALRYIEAGEELMFDYNYDKSFDWLENYNQKYMIKQRN